MNLRGDIEIGRDGRENADRRIRLWMVLLHAGGLARQAKRAFWKIVHPSTLDEVCLCLLLLHGLEGIVVDADLSLINATANSELGLRTPLSIRSMAP